MNILTRSSGRSSVYDSLAVQNLLKKFSIQQNTVCRKDDSKNNFLLNIEPKMRLDDFEKFYLRLRPLFNKTSADEYRLKKKLHRSLG